MESERGVIETANLLGEFRIEGIPLVAEIGDMAVRLVDARGERGLDGIEEGGDAGFVLEVQILRTIGDRSFERSPWFGL